MEPRDKLSCWCLRFDKLRSFNDFKCRVQKWWFISNESWMTTAFELNLGFQFLCFFLAFTSKSVLNQHSDIEISPNCQSSTSNVQPNVEADASDWSCFFFDGVTCGARRAGWRKHQLSIPRAIQRTRRCRIYEACTNLLWFWPSKIVKGNPTTTDFG